MSMVKLIYSDAFDKSVDVGMRVIEDPAVLTKKASTIFGCDYSDLQPGKDHVGIHVVGLGAGERYGSNRNGDFFPKEACVKYHDTFVKHGHVFRHHRNRPEKGDTILGNIKASAYNDDMDRVELFIHAHKDVARDELNRLEKEGEAPFSMACVLDPTYPVLTPLGYKPIGELVEGDIVFTHKGNWKRVKALRRRRYTGRTCKFWLRGLPLPLELTSDHLMYGTKVPSSASRKTVREITKHWTIGADWAHAEHFEIGDRLSYNTPRRIPGYGAIDSVDLAKIMGYYLAEGSLGFNGTRASTLNLACHMDDSLPRVVPGIVERILPGVVCKISPHATSAVGLNVQIFNTEFAEFIRNYVGRGCRGKYICPEIFNSDREIKLNYLGTWLDGDGFVDIKGIHWSTASSNLALQGRDLLASIGVPASIYCIDHAKCATSGMENSGREYTLNISPLNSDTLTPYSVKAATLRTRLGGDYPLSTKNSLYMGDDGRASYRIREVTYRDVVDVQTYNIEVEDDESYTLAGLVSHNCSIPGDFCSICGQFRKSAADPNQCEHIRDQLGELLEDGRKVAMINKDTRFFDISFVGRPADRIAWNLKVAASEVPSSVKLAEASGLWVPDSVAIESASALRKLEILRKVAEFQTKYAEWASKGTSTLSDKYFWELRKSASVTLDDQSIETLRRFEPETVFTGLAKIGAVMDAPSFFKYAFGVNYGDAASYVDGAVKVATHVVRDLVKAGEAQKVCNDATFDVDVTSRRRNVEVPMTALVKCASAFALTGPAIDERTLRGTLSRSSIKIAVDKTTNNEFNTNLAMVVLAEKYAAYKLSALEAILGSHDTDCDSVLAAAAAQDMIER